MARKYKAPRILRRFKAGEQTRKLVARSRSKASKSRRSRRSSGRY